MDIITKYNLYLIKNLRPKFFGSISAIKIDLIDNLLIS